MGEKDALASPNGVDGKYRRTASSPPPPSEKPNPQQGSFSTPTSATNGSSNGHAAHSRQGSNSSSNGGNKTPAKTPKRESPATIAAKGKRETDLTTNGRPLIDGPDKNLCIASGFLCVDIIPLFRHRISDEECI